MILAGDIGGTSTRLGLFNGDPRNPAALEIYSSREHAGLEQAGLYWDGARHRPFATEGGHADFAPRNELQCGLCRYLQAEYGHVSYERVCSGMGLVNVYRYLRDTKTPDTIDLDAPAITR